MKSLFDQIDALRLPLPFSGQAIDAMLTLIMLVILFSVIAAISWVIVLVIERREMKREHRYGIRRIL